MMSTVDGADIDEKTKEFKCLTDAGRDIIGQGVAMMDGMMDDEEYGKYKTESESLQNILSNLNAVFPALLCGDGSGLLSESESDQATASFVEMVCRPSAELQLMEDFAAWRAYGEGRLDYMLESTFVKILQPLGKATSKGVVAQILSICSQGQKAGSGIDLSACCVTEDTFTAAKTSMASCQIMLKNVQACAGRQVQHMAGIFQDDSEGSEVVIPESIPVWKLCSLPKIFLAVMSIKSLAGQGGNTKSKVHNS